MDEKMVKKETEEFFKSLLILNILFPLFITVISVFFYVLGISTEIILGAVLLVLMGYNLIMGRYSYYLWKELRKLLKV